MKRHVGVALGLSVVSVVLVAGFVGSGCAPDPDDSLGSSHPPNGESVEVQALDNTFRPQEISISAGTEVVFVNVGRNEHNVIAAPESELQDWGVGEDLFAPQDEYPHVFDRPGVYPYAMGSTAREWSARSP